MRILVANHSAAHHLGGAELSVLGLVAAWRRERPDLMPHLVSPAAGSAMEAAALSDGWSTSVAPSTGWVSFDAHESRARRRLERATVRDHVDALSAVLDDVRPALVIVNTVVSPWAAVAASERGTPVAWFVREFVDERAGFRLRDGRTTSLRYLDELSRQVFANSEAVRASVADVISPERVLVAHPVIDLDAVAEAAEHRAHLHRGNGPLRVGLVGRVTPEKGQRVAVQAIAELADRGIHAELDIIGGVILPGFDHELKRLARRRGIADRVRLLGEKRRPLEHLSAADVSLVPSPREAFGRVTLESLALGLPVVASPNGGAAELVEHGVSGALVDVTDPVAIADALAAYATDRARIAGHSAAAQRRAVKVIAGPHGESATIAALEAVAATGTVSPKAGADARAALLAPAEELGPAARVALRLADSASVAAHRLGRLVRDPRPPLRRRWVVLSGRVRQRARRG